MIAEHLRAAAAEALQLEIERRDEWYGLDNWTTREVVDFVAEWLEEKDPCPSS